MQMIGEVITEMRTSKNITLEEFSKRTNIPQSTVLRIEKGARVPMFKEFKEIVKVLELSFSERLELEEKLVETDEVIKKQRLNKSREKKELQVEYTLLKAENQRLKEMLKNEKVRNAALGNVTKDLSTKQGRVMAINGLIRFISERGIRAFYSHEAIDGQLYSVAYFTLFKRNKLFFIDSYTKEKMQAGNQNCTYNGFSEGGTLRALVMDFAHFIRTGEYSNGKNGYGGLHSNGWGHDDDVQREIIEYAKEIGYLRKEEVE